MLIANIVSLFCRCRSTISTFAFKRCAVSYGDRLRVARIPRFSGEARVEVGHDCNFNGITIAGHGEVKRRLLLIK